MMVQFRRHRAALAVLLFAGLGAVLPASTLAAVPTGLIQRASGEGDARFTEAHEAYRRNETVRLTRLAAQLEGHPLKPWADYWLLRLRLEADDSSGIGDFLQRESGSYLADRLRAEYLRSLGKAGDWQRFSLESAALVEWDRELRCHAAQATATIEPVRALFLDGRELPAACRGPLTQLSAAGQLTNEHVWQRVRRLHERKQTSEAVRTLDWLTDGTPSAAQRKVFSAAQGEIMKSPARYLSRLPAGWMQQRGGRELVLFAVQRLAQEDADKAADKLSGLASRLDKEQQAYAWLQIAQAGALKQNPSAVSWFANAEATALSDEQMAWRVRVALRAHDWSAVQRAIAAMPAELAAKTDWTYWQGRAHLEQGRPAEARAAFERIAAQPDFYGSLAAEELGRPVSPPPRTLPTHPADHEQVAARPAFQRALALIRLEMRNEGLKEWSFALRDMSDRQLLAAAELARDEGLWDRAISAATRTKTDHDFSLRFLAPFREHVQPRAAELALDYAWVYGLLRQESRFMPKARSSVGAQGLMQVMPATAKYVARKINLHDYRPARLSEINTNVTLGTRYLKMVLDSLDNHPVLASAAYNAGPGRAQRWRAGVPIEGAIYAETIPFAETRDYVKSVMNNAAYYKALFEGRPQSLKALLGVIQPRGAESVSDLP